MILRAGRTAAQMCEFNLTICEESPSSTGQGAG